MGKRNKWDAYPIKDWKRPDQYPSEKGTSLKQWAWEFLRRNPGYQSFFARALKDRDNYIRETAPYDPTDPYESDLTQRDAWAGWEADNIGDWIEKWGILRLGNPENDTPPDFICFPVDLITHPSVSSIFASDREDGLVVGPEQYHVFVDVDLSLPLGRQWKTIIEALSVLKKALPDEPALGKSPSKELRNREDDWQIYLRLLDAESAGASRAEMVKALFPHQDLGGSTRKLDKGRRRAKELAQKEYKSLPAFIL